MEDLKEIKEAKIKETIRLTKLASCAGCGAKAGAGLLKTLLTDLPVREDPNLIVGYDRSDDASVYVVNKDLAIVQTVDFFPPIVDDPELFGQIAACNALSDVYAMGGEPKTALNVMTISNQMDRETIHAILRGGYEKVYEAGAIITGGHTIEDLEPKYGLAVTGFVRPDKVLTNSGAREGDVLILTKKLGIGILTTAAKADLLDASLLSKIQEQMACLNKTARDVAVKYRVHACTDVTGFSLLGHAYEMAEGSGMSLHLESENILFWPDAFEMADMGFVPAGAYRNRDYAEPHVVWKKETPRPMQDILFDPQTSGGLLLSVDSRDAEACLRELQDSLDGVSQIGYVTAGDPALIVE